MCLKAAKKALKKSSSGSVKLIKLQAKLAKAMDVADAERAAWDGVLASFLKAEPSFLVSADRVSIASA